MTEPSDPPPPPSIDALLAQRDWVRMLARRLVTSDERADEVEQRLWLATLERPPAHGGSERGWLAVALRNTARKLGRSESRRGRHEASVPPPRAPDDPAGIVEAAELQQLAGRAVLELPEPYRTTVLLRYFEGLDAAEIATRMNVPAATVRVRLHRGIEKLRERFDDEHEGDRRAWTAAFLAWDGVGNVLQPGEIAGNGVGEASGAGTGKGARRSRRAARLAAAGALVLGLGTWAIVAASRARDDAATGTTETASAPEAAKSSRSHGSGARATPPSAADDTSRVTTTTDLPAGGAADLGPVDPDRDLRGIVVRRDGAPVAGARVEILHGPWMELSLPSRVDGSLESDIAAHTTLRTNTEGRFRLRLEPFEKAEVRVVAAGEPEIRVVPVNAGEELRVVVGRALDVDILACDTQGQPIPALALRLESSGRFGASFEPIEDVTDAAGHLRVRLPPGALPWVSSRDPAWTAMAAPLAGPPEGRVQTVRFFLPARQARGRVVDAATGAPIAGALVRAALSRARTAQDGTFTLAIGRAWFPPQDVIAESPGRHPAKVSTSGEQDVELRLEPEVPLRGRLLLPDGSPAADAAVYLILPKHPDMAETGVARTGTDGRFVLPGAAAGKDVRIAAITSRAARGWFPCTIPEDAKGSFDAGDLRLVEGRTLSGRILLPDGSPDAGRRIAVQGPVQPDESAESPGYAGCSEMLTTDAQGRFRSGPLAPGVYRLQTIPTSRDKRRVVTVTADRDPDPVELKRDGRILRIRAVDSAGEPVRAQVKGVGGAWSEMNPTGEDGRVRLVAAPDTQECQVTPPLSSDLIVARAPVAAGDEETLVVVRRGELTEGVVLAPDGTAVRDGSITLSARMSPGFSGEVKAGVFMSGMVKGRDYVVAYEGKPEAGGTALFGKAPARAGVPVIVQTQRLRVGQVRVKVTNPDGAAVANVRVQVKCEEVGVSRSGRTGADGTVTIANVPDGALRIMASGTAEFGPAVPRAARLADGDIALALRPAARITGTVLREDGTPAAKVRVIAQAGGVSIDAVDAGADGSFSLRVAAGAEETYEVFAVVGADDLERPLREAVVRGIAAGAVGVRIALPRD